MQKLGNVIRKDYIDRFRDTIERSDRASIEEILQSTSMFYQHEIDVALELLDDALEFGQASSYRFIFAEHGTDVSGYSCYGQIPCTDSSYDLYWLAVRHDQRRKGIGRSLLVETERRLKHVGARRLFAETSSREVYYPTQAFYASCGYALEARLRDFYAPGDDRLTYGKVF